MWWSYFLGRCPSSLFLPFSTPTWSISSYRALYLPPRRIHLNIVSIHLHSILSTLSLLLWSPPLKLWLYIKTSTNTPGYFSFPPSNSTAPAPTANNETLRTHPPSFFVEHIYVLGPTWSTKHIQVITFYFQSKHRLPTVLSPINVATTTTTFFKNERTPIHIVQQFPPLYPWGHTIYHVFYLLWPGNSAPPSEGHLTVKNSIQ